MKKTLLLLFGLCTYYFSAAQITLDFSNSPSIAQCASNDTFALLKRTNLPSFAPGSDVVWDLTTAQRDDIIYRRAYPADNSAYPDASFQIEIFYPFSGLKYYGNRMQNVTQDGILSYGVHIDRQAISLALLTGSPSDSLIFNHQNVIYSAPAHDIKYPMTMSDQWTDDYRFNTSFSLTVGLFGLNNVPGERRTEYIENNEVVGWGKMKVNDKDGNPSPLIDVLLVKKIETAKDSFYLGGAPAPAQLLTAFGLTQGQSSISYRYYFYRAGEKSALAEVKFVDDSFTTIEEALVHQQRLGSTNAINKPAPASIAIYPNPVSSHTPVIHIDGTDDHYSYQMFNINGQQINSGTVNGNGIITLHDNYPAGNYILKLISDKGRYEMKQIQIVN